MSTRSEAEVRDHLEALAADRSELLAAVTQQWDPWERIPGQPPNCRRWRGFRGQPERVEQERLLLRVSLDAWYAMLSDPRLFESWPWKLFTPNPGRLAGVEVRTNSSLPAYAWRLVLRGIPEIVRAEGTYGNV